MSEMAEEWIVRVQGKDYGPVDVETLREWKAEGRLLPSNQVRRIGLDLWTTAADIPGLFGPASSTHEPAGLARRSLGAILIDAVRIYRKGFLQFFGLTLLIAVPSFCAQLTSSTLVVSPNVEGDLRTLIAGSFTFCMLLLSLAAWPVFIAGIQILTAELAAGRSVKVFSVLRNALKFWSRVAMLWVFVFVVFALLTLFALAIAVMVVAGASSLLLIFFALALLILQVWMFGRFFINVLFWQQFAVLENAGVIDSLRESRNLARSGRDLPWFRRPMWRGIFIASIWFAFVLVLNIGSEWHSIQHYFHELSTVQDPQALLQNLTASSKPERLNVSLLALSLLQTVLRPLLGIAFVLLYLDSKSASRTDSSHGEIDLEQ
jgi:hypothetical protein